MLPSAFFLCVLFVGLVSYDALGFQFSRSAIVSSMGNTVGKNAFGCRPYRLQQVSDGESSMDASGEEDNELIGPEKSRMNEYIGRFLGKTAAEENNNGAVEDEIGVSFGKDEISSSTHLIAIPMDTCHELLIELESVQRAILYHCPVLVDACIAPSMVRLPLLYIRAPDVASAHVTTFLSELVQSVVQKHILDPVMDANEEDIDEELLNGDGVRPLTMTFQSLEIEGANNNILSTVGLPDSHGTKILVNLIQDLRKNVEKKGWQVILPNDPLSSNEFRPRVSFMELPQGFSDAIDRLKDASTEITEEDAPFLTSDGGGNGISPIFWCQWWDDVFGRDVRLKEIGIFPRSAGFAAATSASDSSYSNFYLPYETIPLPDGNPAMLRQEEKFRKYQDERIGEQQTLIAEQQSNESPYTSDSSQPSEGPDVLMTKTRQRLEKIYMDSSVGYSRNETLYPGTSAFNEGNEDKDNQIGEEVVHDVATSPQTDAPEDYMEDWMKARIQKAIDSQESVKSRNPEKKVMPPIEDNPVFKAYKDGTVISNNKKFVGNEVAPYPSREYFVGIWKVVTSPTGFPIVETGEGSSENLILRIDGTIAGGPILDPETKQKAAGGTWKVIEEGGDVSLRIRLVIPPKKERIMEMMGAVTRMNLNTDISMASKAFGVPYLEAMAQKANAGLEDLVYCGGDVSLEDAVTKRNRESIGTFSLMKLQGPRGRGDYTITIPKPIRNQD